MFIQLDRLYSIPYDILSKTKKKLSAKIFERSKKILNLNLEFVLFYFSQNFFIRFYLKFDIH